MGFFNWATPFMQRYGERWTDAGVQRIGSWLSPFLSEEPRILDVGGGTGGLAVRLADALDACVTILDPTPEMLERVPEHGSVESVLGDVAEMPFEADRFDALVVSDAFHHFRDQAKAVIEMRRVTRPGGGVVILELDRSNLAIRLIAFAERLLREPGYFFTPQEMCDFMREHGIEGTCESGDGPDYYFIGTVTE